MFRTSYADYCVRSLSEPAFREHLNRLVSRKKSLCVLAMSCKESKEAPKRKHQFPLLDVIVLQDDMETLLDLEDELSIYSMKEDDNFRSSLRTNRTATMTTTTGESSRWDCTTRESKDATPTKPLSTRGARSCGHPTPSMIEAGRLRRRMSSTSQCSNESS